ATYQACPSPRLVEAQWTGTQPTTKDNSQTPGNYSSSQSRSNGRCTPSVSVPSATPVQLRTPESMCSVVQGFCLHPLLSPTLAVESEYLPDYIARHSVGPVHVRLQRVARSGKYQHAYRWPQPESHLLPSVR